MRAIRQIDAGGKDGGDADVCLQEVGGRLKTEFNAGCVRFDRRDGNEQVVDRMASAGQRIPIALQCRSRCRGWSVAGQNSVV